MLVDAQVTTAQPPRVSATVRWTWPATTRLTWGERASSSPSAARSDAGRPISSSHGRPTQDRRVVHGDDRRRLAVVVELLREPADVELPVVATRDRGVARDQAQRADARDVAQRLTEEIVVAGDEMDRHRQRREQLARALVLAGVTGVGDVARDDDGIRRLGKRENARDGGGERGTGVLVAGAFEPDVGIADLGEQGRRGHAAAD